LAKKLISEAKKTGADAIKFQTFIPDQISSKIAKTAVYQSKKQYSQYKLLKKLSLNFKEKILLKNYCKKKKILLSTGMSTSNEIKDAIDILVSNGTNKKNITLLHCNSAYPTPPNDVNLKSLPYLQKKFQVNVGLSDHSEDLIASVLSVPLGAKFIEKHFTLKKHMTGPDHKSSLEPKDFKKLVEYIRLAEKMMGHEKKVVSKSEKVNLNYVRKSIVASKDIKKGEVFNSNNITTKRPGYGISPMKLDIILGKVSKKNFSKDQLIKL
jgi:sialic acid synthase SpsE